MEQTLPLLSPEQNAALKRVRLLALDVDGVLTDGGVYFTSSGGEMRRFNVSDGLGIVVASLAGLKIAWMSGRNSPVVEHRARELGVTLLQQGVREKGGALAKLIRQNGILAEDAAFMGDDLNDLAALRSCGVAILPANCASPELRALPNAWVTPRRGGDGAVRDAIEAILRARGDWDAALASYLASLGSPIAKTPIN